MSNLFDQLQRGLCDIAAQTFGYDASWNPADGSDQKTARVLFKEPTKEYELGGIPYSPLTYIAEYFTPDFPGLYESVSVGTSEELSVNGQMYYVAQVTAINDGKTYRAVLTKI